MILDRFLSVFSIVSRIGVKIKFNFDPSRMDFYLPLIGIFPALLGLAALNGIFLLIHSPLISVLTALIVQYFCFNLFHLDGLMDTADAFLGTHDAEKRFLILKDYRIGVYGFFAGIVILSLKTALLLELFPLLLERPAFLLTYPIFGRFSAALVPCMAKPAKPSSLGSLAQNSKSVFCIAGLFTGLVVWFLICRGWVLFAVPDLIIPGISLAICVLNSLFYARLYKRSLGGYTGDTLGASIETGEILHLLIGLIFFTMLTH
ncbi:adenosylcobinamide-GDP ribazoletransferase [Spirochaetia bacterium]|nr:adenosylcobinamide-GDP ribazoletransferase [Spirochaetia bacterium]